MSICLTETRSSLSVLTSAEGKIVKTEENKLIMTDMEGNNKNTHDVATDAVIMFDGKECKLADLEKGQRIKVTKGGDAEIVTHEDHVRAALPALHRLDDLRHLLHECSAPRADTARFKRATAPYGIDIIYYFHRLAAVAAIILILAHFLILRIAYIEALGSADPRSASWHMTAGRIAMLLFVVLVATSLWRKPLRIEYDRWRLWHALVAIAAFVVAVVLGLVGGYLAVARVLGETLYRQGDLDAAVPRLAASIRAAPGVGAQWRKLFLAMAYYRLNRTAEAQQLLIEATQWMEQNAREKLADGAELEQPLLWCQRVELQLIHQEAQELPGKKD